MPNDQDDQNQNDPRSGRPDNQGTQRGDANRAARGQEGNRGDANRNERGAQQIDPAGGPGRGQPRGGPDPDYVAQHRAQQQREAGGNQQSAERFNVTNSSTGEQRQVTEREWTDQNLEAAGFTRDDASGNNARDGGQNQRR